MEIKIGKSARHCTGCSREFVHEESLHSVARLEDGTLHRDDFCDSCWRSTGGAHAFSVWHSKFYDPRIAEQEPAEVFSPLRQLFYESVDASDRREMSKAYLAAHLLRRQKVFRLIKESDATDEEVSIALFSDRIGNRLIEVRDPSLSHEELETGRLLLLARLKELEDGGAPDDESPEISAEVPPTEAVDESPEAASDEAPEESAEVLPPEEAVVGAGTDELNEADSEDHAAAE